MKHIITIIIITKTIILLFCLPLFGYGQILEKIKNTTKTVIENRIDSKVESSINQGVDAAEESMKKKNKKDPKKKTVTKGDTTKSTPSKSNLIQESNQKKETPQNKFEFEPGDELIYSEDFGQDVLDEFPVSWFTNNNGKITAPSFSKGKWLMMTPSSQYLSPILNQNLPDNYTIEFDLNLNLTYQGYVYPEIKFGVIENIKNDLDGRLFFIEDRAKGEISSLNFTIFPAEESNSLISLESYHKGSLYFQKEGQSLQTIHKQFGKSIKVSIWIQKNRFRLWFDKNKIFDIPKGVPNATFNRLLFQISSSIQNEDEVAVFVSNLRVATASPDIRSKFINEGRFSTNAILFDSNSDVIKSESKKALIVIAEILKENINTKVKIIGHTDSDGNDNDNLILSKKRAIAVKNKLVSEYGINAERLSTDGEGENKPVGNNSSEDGKKLNRRVEFIKM